MMADKRIRILYLDHGTKPVGGGQVNTLSLIGALDRSRFTPFVLSSSENAFTQGARDIGVEVVVMPLPRALTELGRWSVRYDPYHVAVYSWHAARAALRIARIVKRQQIDILHPCDNLMRTLCAIVATLLRKPVVCPIMEELSPNLTSRLVRWLVLNTMDFALPVSERAALFFRQGGRRKARIVVTYTGIDLDQFTDAVAAAGRAERAALYGDALVIGIVGRLIPIKGHRELFHALALLKKTTTRAFRCLVVGDGPDLDALRALATELDLEEEVSFTGFHRDVAKVMSLMHIVVAPSHAEASSRVVLEAGALQLPVVATRIGGIPEMVEDGVTGILVDLGDVAGLAHALETFTDADVRQRMGTAGYQRVHDRFANSVITQGIEDIYVSAVSSRGRRS